MLIDWIRRPALLSLSLSAALAVAVAGCGGQPSDSSTAVVVPPANSLTNKTTASAEAAPAAGASAPAAAASTASTSPVKAEGWGTLKGQIVFGGDPPPAAILQEQGKAAKDPNVCAKDAPIKSERLVVGDGKGVKFAIVYLPKPTAVNEDAKKAAAAKKVEFDQKGCMFEPHVLGLMAGVPITLKSSDPLSHNVNIKLKASTSSNQTISGGQSIVFTPTAKENTPGQVVCDIHPWMTAWWMVVDNPYIAVTDDKGYFEIKNVPAGTQRVVVWQEAVANRGFVTPPSGEDVTIKANDTAVKDFTIDPSKLLPAG
jgi:plastocyanin